jgi:osmotically-inducible protein OsmY
MHVSHDDSSGTSIDTNFLSLRLNAMLDRIQNLLVLVGASAGLMYLFDPDVGKRRRSLLRDKVTHAAKKMRKAAAITLRDMEHRLYGVACELRAKLRGRDTSDEIVIDRVRSKLGRYISHPSSIEVHVRDGCLTLCGPILSAEVVELLRARKSVEGVREVRNLLQVHASPENVSALQGGRRRTREPAEWMQANWSPSARVVVGTAGTLLMLNCLAKRTLPAIALGTAGFALFLPRSQISGSQEARKLPLAGRTMVE